MAMKIKLYKHQMYQALVWYNNKLSEKFLHTPVTPATEVLAQRYLAELHNYAKNNPLETNPAWQVDVKVEVRDGDYGRPSLCLDIANPEQILYLDFDS